MTDRALSVVPSFGRSVSYLAVAPRITPALYSLPNRVGASTAVLRVRLSPFAVHLTWMFPFSTSRATNDSG